jgi:hypothetical protein
MAAWDCATAPGCHQRATHRTKTPRFVDVSLGARYCLTLLYAVVVFVTDYSDLALL